MTRFPRCSVAVLVMWVACGSLARGQQLPIQQPAAQQPQLPQLPPQFQLNAMEQAYLDQVLSSWQNESAKVTIFQCPFERWEYDKAFGPNDRVPLHKKKGDLSYHKPDKGSFEITEVRTWDQKAGDWLVQKDAIGEHWVCDGQNVYEYRTSQKQLVVRPIPAAMQGKAIVDGPLPFLFGADAAKLKARYWMRADQLQTPDKILIQSLPRFQADAADYKQVDVILDRQRMLPVAMRVFLPNGDRQEYIFDIEKADVNGHLQRILSLFQSPRTPWGWTRVVEEAQPQQPLPPGGRQAAQPDSVPR